FNGPLAYFDGQNPNALFYRTPEPMTRRGIGPDGAVDGSLGFPFGRQVAIAPYYQYARQAGLPFSEFGLYKNRSITDPGIFDFYNNLLDGDNKNEWQDFTSASVSLSQTFMNDRFGFEAAYNTETYENGQYSMLSGDRYAIFVDVM